MKVTMPLVLLTALLGCAAATEVICYWGAWSHYRTGAGKVTVSDLDPNKCTVYIYAFATLNPTTYQIQASDVPLDITKQNYANFVAMNQTNSKLKRLLAIGGYKDSKSSNKYSLMMASTTNRATFVSSVVAFLQTHGFDGLDFDYEYPTSSDKAHYTSLLTELKAALQPLGLMLTAAVTANKHTISAGYDVPAVSQQLDMLHVMAYDMHGPWEANADHHAAFQPRASDAGSGLDLQSVMAEWTSRGAPAAKLAAGLPSYGKSWKVSGANKVPPVAGNGAGTAGIYTGEAGTLSYLEICLNINAGWTVVQDPSEKIGPYAYSGDQWVAYDDKAMVALKTQWAVSQGFGGVMIWEAAFDDVKNTCGGGAWPLISAIGANLGGSSGTTSTTTTTTTTTTTAASGGPFTCPSPNGFFADPADCRSFYQCSGGIAYHNTCASGTIWSPTAGVCDWGSC